VHKRETSLSSLIFSSSHSGLVCFMGGWMDGRGVWGEKLPDDEFVKLFGNNWRLF
jgi:hypothetical protein